MVCMPSLTKTMVNMKLDEMQLNIPTPIVVQNAITMVETTIITHTKHRTTMKKVYQIIALGALGIGLHSCASVSGAGVADYNGDGYISDAEAAQYHRQKDVEDRNVYTESNKRRNATNTIRDTRDGAYYARDLKNIINNF